MKRHFNIKGMPLQLLLLLCLSGSCSSEQEKVKERPGTAEAVQASNDARESQTDTVEIKEMKFQPATLTVAPGTTVVFVNRDMVTHDVTEAASKAWSSKPLPPSKAWSMIANKSSDYYCSIHAVMKGKIVVNK